jgi:hypothetical protein
LQVSDAGTLMVEPLRILDHRVRQLKNRLVDQVKVQWDKYSPDLLLGRMQRPYDEIIPTFLTTSGICFLEGWVYVMPPFDLDN